MNSFEKSIPKISQKIDVLEHVKTPEETIEFRYNQSYASRLAEFITGLRPDHPKFAKRLALDQKIIREKYSLPDRKAKWETPLEYENFLRERAKKSNTLIRDKSDCGSFFKNNSYDGVFFDERNEIGSTINKGNIDTYTKSLGILEHEFIHSQQAIFSPSMPVELKEYEAYIAGVNPTYAEDPEAAELLFSFLIGGSVNFWYREINKKKNENEQMEIAVYDDPDYFLKNIDLIDEETIKAYEKKLLINI